ncbi:MAG: nucleotidyltransferase domain-containing protein [Gemmataceae bacterium]
MLDMDKLRKLVESQGHTPLFVTVSGAHLYGFPSPDSDVDLRGAHLLPLAEVVALDPPVETLERNLDQDGTEIDLVSHDLGKYLRLLMKNNGYVLEQIFSPLVVLGQAFLDELRPLAQRCITRHHYHHYRGFINTQKRLLDRQETKQVKPLLYAYRVLLTGIHLLRTGEVEPNLPRLAEEYRLPFIPDLIAQKRQEKQHAPDLDWPWHAAQLAHLEADLDAWYTQSPLGEERPHSEVSAFLVERRLWGKA